MVSTFFGRSLIAICLALLGSGLPHHSHAADVALHTDPVMSCYLRLEGPIDAADPDRLKQMLKRYNESTSSLDFPSSPRICLNSQGGDYAAALAIIDQLGGRFSTAIGSGDACTGACALVFMAGREGDGGTVDSRQGGRIVHPKATLSFGGSGVTPLDTAQIAQVIGLQTTYDIHSDIILAMLDTSADARTLATVAEASLWQIRVGPTVMPDKLSPLAVLMACNHASAPLIDRLRFADDELHDPDWPERDTPQLLTYGSGVQTGQLALKINGRDVTCEVSYYGAHSLPTGQVGVVSLSIGGGDGAELYRPLYGPMLFTDSTPLQTLARQSDTVAEPVAITSRNAPDKAEDDGLCGLIADGKLIRHSRCVRTEYITSDTAFNELIRTTFDSGNGALIVATATGEYGRRWPQNMEPEYTLDGVPADAWSDGMPDEGEDGNDPGADTACRIVTNGQSQWCPTSFWRRQDTGEVFLFIADRHTEAGLEYSGWD
nr:hypothetical protein [uncultured Roseovarius sp.]